jgi:hypothetical protein
MSVHTEWVNEPYIIAKHFEGHVTGRELDEVMHSAMQAVSSSELYLLFDFSEARLLPEKIFELASIAQLLSHPNVRWVALVSPEGSDARTTRLLARGKIKVFEDTKMAIAFLRGMVRIDLGVILEENGTEETQESQQADDANT